jgi:hypothetical protein
MVFERDPKKKAFFKNFGTFFCLWMRVGGADKRRGEIFFEIMCSFP